MIVNRIISFPKRVFNEKFQAQVAVTYLQRFKSFRDPDKHIHSSLCVFGRGEGLGSRKNVLRGVVLVLSDFDIQTAGFASGERRSCFEAS